MAEASEQERIQHQRIALFRSLFRGRDDVYARRWQSADGRSGYMPASLKDWNAINRSRPEDRRKVDQATRTLLPLTDAVIERHLSGRETIGIYPLLADETCCFLAVDFDKKTWADDARAFMAMCHDLGVPAALERSRSGTGAHVWIFFDTAVSVATARKLGSLLLTRTMERRHQLGLDSYDRLFPNQDTMPKGGFGNLIALPLQFGPRQVGNSVFIDADLAPYPDQWQFLASLTRMPASTAEELVAQAQRAGALIGVRISLAEDEAEHDPWTLPPSKKRREERPITEPLPERVQVVRANRVYVDKHGLPSAMLNRLLRLAAFQNPEFYRAQALRLSTYAKPRVIACGDELPRHIALPRGCLADAVALLEAHNVTLDVRDERFAGIPIDVTFHGQLRATQAEAVAQSTGHDEGIISAPTAFGKTAIAAWLVAARKVNTLVLVHRQQLLDQWRERLALFLGLPAQSIGQIGGGKTARTGCVDVAVIQSLYRHDEVRDFVAEYGQVIVDECHHIAAFSFEQVMKQVKAKYVLGLTATPTRKDGHHPIIYMQCGPLRFHQSAKTMTDATPFEHRVMPRHTDFRMTLGMPSTQDSDAADAADELTIQDVYAALLHDEARNTLILADLVHALTAGRSPLLLTNRTEHLKLFATQLSQVAAIAKVVTHIFVMKGGMGKKQRQAMAEALAVVPEDESRVILATGSYIGEGFDDARLDTLFLAMPISWKGTLQQYVGRLHRLHDNKRVVQVYDYVDSHVPMLARMYERRVRGYTAIGYVVEEASLEGPQHAATADP
jgi:superfamily II DNA or RNA helicase